MDCSSLATGFSQHCRSSHIHVRLPVHPSFAPSALQVATREHSRDIGAWGTWVMVAFVLVGGPMQYLVLQRTILKEELWYAVPLYQSLLIAFSVFAGGTFNHEWVNA